MASIDLLQVSGFSFDDSSLPQLPFSLRVVVR